MDGAGTFLGSVSPALGTLEGPGSMGCELCKGEGVLIYMPAWDPTRVSLTLKRDEKPLRALLKI